MTEPIHTARLDLIPMTPAFLQASIGGDLAEAGKQLGLWLPEGWPVLRNILELRLEQLKLNPALQPWLLRAIALRRSRRMVGIIGFHGAPGADYLREWSPGGVEYGFSIFPPHRRRGYAREASLALMQWAHDLHGVTGFVVSVNPDNLASQALVADLGFVRAGSHVDPVEGPEDVLVLRWPADGLG